MRRAAAGLSSSRARGSRENHVRWSGEARSHVLSRTPNAALKEFASFSSNAQNGGDPEERTWPLDPMATATLAVDGCSENLLSRRNGAASGWPGRATDMSGKGAQEATLRRLILLSMRLFPRSLLVKERESSLFPSPFLRGGVRGGALA